MKSPEPRVTTMRLDEIDGYPRLVLGGECDRGMALRLSQCLDQLIRGGCRGVMLDTREVRYLDNHCCQALAGGIKRLRAAGGACVIVDQGDPLERALKLLNLGELAEAVPTVGQASSYLSWA